MLETLIKDLGPLLAQVPRDGQLIWCCLANSSWTEERLKRFAVLVARARGLSLDLVSDICQESLLRLRRRCLGRVGLRLDHDRSLPQQRAYLDLLYLRCCLDGARTFWRHRDRVGGLEHSSELVARNDNVEERIALRELIHRLEEPYRTAMVMQLQGYRVGEIVACLKQMQQPDPVSSSTAYRQIKEARKALAKAWSEG